uniref:Neuroguidin n=1 Tax=Terrapene triunguis TaxID=2587831 RepID=A0A674JXP1_9SAUR
SLPTLQEQLVSDLPPALALLGSLQEQVRETPTPPDPGSLLPPREKAPIQPLSSPPQVVGVTAHVQGLLQRVRAGAFPTEKGLSFLELKAQLLLFYLQDLAQLVLEKTSGRSLVAQPAVLRLAELRTVLEKMRPIEQKLRYQVDKLVKAAVTGAVGDDNPLRFKPDPGNMMSKVRGRGRGRTPSFHPQLWEGSGV